MTPAGLAPTDPAPLSGTNAAEGARGASSTEAAGARDVPTPAHEPGASAGGELLPSPHGRHAAGEPDVEPGPLLAAGNTADVFALDDRHVLRRYRTGTDASGEVALMRHVASYGFPVPEVVRVDGADVVMERLHGPTLLQALGAEELSVHDGAALLAELHERLHAVPPPEGTPEHDVVAHLDLHPGNVILSEDHGPTVIDWASACTASAALDVALTSLVIAEVAVDAGGVYSRSARALLAAFLAASSVDPSSALDEGARLRMADPALLEGEAELVPHAAALIRDLVDVARPA